MKKSQEVEVKESDGFDGAVISACGAVAISFMSRKENIILTPSDARSLAGALLSHAADQEKWIKSKEH